jgi:hypothetical protein
MSLRSRAEHGNSFFNLLLEVILIGVGVFLALLANNWHEDREHRALAESTLRNFAEEMRTNQQAVQKERQYHETLAREIHQFLTGNQPLTAERFQATVHFTGVRPITFEHTAWDLALATQALSYLKPELAFDISKVYTRQSALQRLEDSFLSSVYTPAALGTDDPKGLVSAIQLYLGDVNVQEPIILDRYSKVIPEVQRVLPNSEPR